MAGTATGAHLSFINNGAVVKRVYKDVAASQTDSELVAAVANKSIVVLSFMAICGATATTLTFNSKGSGAGTAISQLIANGANGGEVRSEHEYGLWVTNNGEALTCTTGAGSSTGISVSYIEL